jgi:ribosomal protein S12 methylthiotransferase
MRGKHVSKPIEDLVTESENLAKNGVKELILIAQDLTYYGLDIYKKRRLADLLLALKDVDGIEWIRLHYAFPTGFPQDVLDVIRDEEKVCNYIDIPLQHIADNVLKSMKRGTTFKKTNSLLRDFREKVPGMAIRTSLIVGYPGETEKDFEILKNWVRDTKFDRLGVFTYSHEENTSAYDLEDDVPAEVKAARAEEIMAIQQEVSMRLNGDKVGKEFKVLIDRKEGNFFIGRTEFDSPDVDNEVLIDASKHFVRQGDFVQVKVYEASDYDLFAEPI